MPTNIQNVSNRSKCKLHVLNSYSLWNVLHFIVRSFFGNLYAVRLKVRVDRGHRGPVSIVILLTYGNSRNRNKSNFW